MSRCDQLLDALYALFSTPVLFPKEDVRFDQLCGLGYAAKVKQGKAEGYRITPDGHRVAHDRWGHAQS